MRQPYPLTGFSTSMDADGPAARTAWLGNRETNHEGVPMVGFPVERP